MEIVEFQPSCLIGQTEILLVGTMLLLLCAEGRYLLRFHENGRLLSNSNNSSIWSHYSPVALPQSHVV